jgi:hypothetical protein
MNARFHDVALTLRGTQCRRESDSRRRRARATLANGPENAGKRASPGAGRRQV